MAVVLLAAAAIARLTPAPRASAAGPQATDFELSVGDPRPVAAAIARLEQRHGWVITYEDPRYSHASDLLDVTAQRPPAAVGGVPLRSLIPLGGRVSFAYSVSPAGDPIGQAAAVAGRLVESVAGDGNPPAFRVIRSSRMVHVVPGWVRGADGVPIEQRSILEERVGSIQGRRTVFESLQALCADLSEIVRMRVAIGVVPGRLMQVEDTSRDPVSRGTAREALERTLGAVSPRLSWTLLFDPTLGWNVLNVHAVPER